MPLPFLPFCPAFQPRRNNGVIEFPVHHMRGGTSTGLVLWEPFAPRAPQLRAELLRHLMGLPSAGRNDQNRQITGLGRGSPTSNKVFFAAMAADTRSPVLVSTLAQLAHNHADVDWSVNCGNMSASLQLWALDTGLLAPAPDGHSALAIRNTNTGVTTLSRMRTLPDGTFALAAIPGVDGRYPAVDLFMQDPVGARTGRLLPTGAVADVIDGCRVSCVDVAVPMAICAAADLGKSGHETMDDLVADAAFMARLRTLWIAAGLKMGLQRPDGAPMTAADLARSETIPKICIVGAPRAGGHLAVRYFTPQHGHASLAVSGGCCLAAAALIPGSVAHGLVPPAARASLHVTDACTAIQVGLEHPAGILDSTVVCRMHTGQLDIRSAAYRRSTQILVRGHVPLYGASDELAAALLPA